MKVNVCFKCKRIFENDFLYCPYCGDSLKKVEVFSFEESKEKKTPTNKSASNKPPVKEKPTKKENEYFFSSLADWERKFIDAFYLKIQSSFKQICMKESKSYVYFYIPSDKNEEMYGHWFYITKRDGQFMICYRSKPDISIKPVAKRIYKMTSLSEIANTILEIVRNRLYPKVTVITKTKNQPDEKKQLAPKSDHSNIFLAGDHPGDKFFGDVAEGERKTQKEVWEVNNNYYYRKK